MGSLQHFTSKVPYIARDPLYNEEKPFSCDFDHSDSIYATNHKFDWQPIIVKDVVNPDDFNLETHGFCVLKANTSLSPDNALADKQKIEDSYSGEIEALLRQHFPEYSRIEMMNVVVRQIFISVSFLIVLPTP